MSKRQRLWVATVVAVLGFLGTNLYVAMVRPHRILLDTDVDTDDLFALLYLLKLSRSEFNLEAVTIIANAWSDGGHAVNQVYDILYMMGRDDVAVGLGGEGGILANGTLLSNVGGYLPIIDQGLTTTGGCRYRQAIPKGPGGRLDIDTNFGLRRQFLPQGNRRYSPLQQPTAQQVLIDKVSEGPITLIVLGANTNIALFLMSNPHLKKNIEHIYVMGGALRASNHCAKNSTRKCRSNNVGNLFTGYESNPYAEFNMFADPFAAYQVFHSGVPVTLVPLDATNTIPINKEFFEALEMNQKTYEAQYAYLSLKMVRDAMFGDQFSRNGEKEFLENYFLWDSFTTGIAVSILRNSGKSNGENDFAEMEYRNITVVTSNEPYGISDGSNKFFDNQTVPTFNLTRGGVHSGHVQTGLHDAFCISTKGKGKCKDGYTQEISGPDSVRVLVATRAKLNKNNRNELNREFYLSLLEVLSRPQQAGRFNFSSEFQYYTEQWHRPSFRDRKLGRPVLFDMDMSAGDFLSLFYLLKVPVEVIDLKAIIASPTGWANAATIDVIYDLLHMMGRDDIPVGMGDIFAVNQSDPIFPAVGECKYAKAVPNGSGGFLDSDTLFGLGRDLPRSPRRYSAEKSVAHRQPLALKVWENVVKSLDPGTKITILTNGPLTSLAKIISLDKNATSMIKEVYIVGGHISGSKNDEGNVFTVPSNRYVEFNMYLDPLAAKSVLESDLNITLVPLGTQRKLSSFRKMLDRLSLNQQTAEAQFAQRLLSRLYVLEKNLSVYQHVDMFLGEILGAVFLGGDQYVLKPSAQVEHLKVIAEGNESRDGRILIDRFQGKPINILQDLDSTAYYEMFASRLGDQKQSAVIGSFEEQRKQWSRPHIET